MDTGQVSIFFCALHRASYSYTESLGYLLTASYHFASRSLIPILGLRADRDLIVAVLTSLAPRPDPLHADSKLIYTQLLKAGLDKICLKQDDFHLKPDKPWAKQYYAYYHVGRPSPRDEFLSTFARILFIDADANGLTQEATDLLLKSCRNLTYHSLPTWGPELSKYSRTDNNPTSKHNPGLSEAEGVLKCVQQLLSQLQTQNHQLPSHQRDALHSLIKLLLRYIIFHIPDRPQVLQTWVYRPLETCTRSCSVCHAFNLFLACPLDQTFSFEHGVDNIKHLQGRIANRREVFDQDVDKHPGMSHRLTVRKRTPQCPVAEAEWQAWHALLWDWVSFMQRLQTEEVRLILGEQVYREVILLDTIQVGGRHPLEALVLPVDSSRGTGTVLQPWIQDANASTAPSRKRVADDGLENLPRRQRIYIVDLTSD